MQTELRQECNAATNAFEKRAAKSSVSCQIKSFAQPAEVESAYLSREVSSMANQQHSINPGCRFIRTSQIQNTISENNKIIQQVFQQSIFANPSMLAYHAYTLILKVVQIAISPSNSIFSDPSAKRLRLQYMICEDKC